MVALGLFDDSFCVSVSDNVLPHQHRPFEAGSIAGFWAKSVLAAG